jgi:hypothetical protein
MYKTMLLDRLINQTHEESNHNLDHGLHCLRACCLVSARCALWVTGTFCSPPSVLEVIYYFQFVTHHSAFIHIIPVEG